MNPDIANLLGAFICMPWENKTRDSWLAPNHLQPWQVFGHDFIETHHHIWREDNINQVISAFYGVFLPFLTSVGSLLQFHVTQYKTRITGVIVFINGQSGRRMLSRHIGVNANIRPLLNSLTHIKRNRMPTLFNGGQVEHSNARQVLSYLCT